MLTHTCSIDPAIVESTGGRLLLESPGIRSSHSMCSMVTKRVPLRPIFRLGNSQKSLGARSGDYGRWVMTGMLFSARNCCTTSDVWLGAFALHNKRCVARCVRTEPHIASCAAIPRRLKHSCHYPTTVLSGSRSE